MKFTETPLAGAYVIDLEPKLDIRGSFVRTFCKKEFELIGFHEDFVQINESFNLLKGTFRGIHFQKDTYSENKLVRCVAGSVFDIIVDVRKESPTYMKHYSVIISSKNLKMILIPKGFAHGFLTLEDNTSLLFHHTKYYQPDSEVGIRYDDPRLGIKLPIPISVINPRDQSY